MLLELDHISKIYGDLRAVDDLNLTVPEGEWLPGERSPRGPPSSAPPAQARPR